MSTRPSLLPVALVMSSCAFANAGYGAECRFVLQHGKEIKLTDTVLSPQYADVLKSGSVSKPLSLRSSDGEQCIQLEGQNPVFYRYTWKQESKGESENYGAAIAFAGALGTLIKGLGPVVSDEQARAEATKKAVYRSLSAETIDPKERAAIKLRLETERALAGVIANTGDFLSEVQERLSRLERCLTAMEAAVKGLGEGKKVPPEALCPSDKPEALETDLADVFKKIDSGQAELLQMVSAGAPGIADQPFFVASTLLQFQRKDLLEGARKVRILREQLVEMQEPLDLGNVSYLPKDDQVWSLQIERIDDNAKGESFKKATGDFKLRFVPYSPVRLGLGAAAIYSFVSDAKYTTQPVDGGFRIVESPDQKQYQEGGIAAVLTITPRGWTDPTFGGFFEVGVQPTDDLGLIAGAGIRLFDIASFGAGIAFQQVDVLAPGLSLGDTIAAESDLKTAKRFKAGVYLHITLSIDVKK